MLIVLHSIAYASIQPNKILLVYIQELLLAPNLTIIYAVSYQGSGNVFSTVTNVMISLALIQFCMIVLHHFLTFTCHCNILVVLQNVGSKVIKFFPSYSKTNKYPTNIALLNIPERACNYTEYQGGLVSDDFK